ncbi:dihydroorotase [Butyrivibrio sp. YAB3001]|uniref:dihydroorotase n=1 Tax=Butyrivibrio sp. YAB3001 TaxID=1520812 RepID=UPI0008F6834B|nr:dihydroorotase [Butyrivibrio sp. YAB3001]SFC09044.1 dihydroorotase [Butyrivibrio sp. YAB3001]
MLIIKDGYLIDPASKTEGKRDIVIEGDTIVKICESSDEFLKGKDENGDVKVIDASGKIVAPGFVDCHVHFRDPGFTYKEDIKTGALAAARGGFTSVVMMGNTNPHMDNAETIKDVLERGRTTGINVYACGNVTRDMAGKELTDMEKLVEAGSVLFTDDGKPLTDGTLMEKACVEAAKLGKVVSLHEEDPEFITENGINAGKVAKKLGLTGSPREAEISMVKRDISIAEKVDAEIVIQHISAEESVELIRQAKKRGAKVHAEATPHHFTLTENAILKYGSLAKMNPPLRFESDRQAIIEGLRDGTIEMIATDHAPHSREEKSKGLTEAPSGIIGLETSLALGIRELVDTGYLSLGELIKRMTIGPAQIYGLEAGVVAEGKKADLCVFARDEKWDYVSSSSKASNTPFLGERLPGKIYYTICNGQIVYSDN